MQHGHISFVLYLALLSPPNSTKLNVDGINAIYLYNAPMTTDENEVERGMTVKFAILLAIVVVVVGFMHLQRCRTEAAAKREQALLEHRRQEDGYNSEQESDSDSDSNSSRTSVEDSNEGDTIQYSIAEVKRDASMQMHKMEAAAHEEKARQLRKMQEGYIFAADAESACWINALPTLF